MTDHAGRRVFETDPETSRRMAGIRQHATTPELAVRQALRALGIAFRTKNRDLPGSPDLANRARKWAIFVHGCYWHRHEGCDRTTTPTRNREAWEEKFDANVARDRRTAAALAALGYDVLTVWECETRSAGELQHLVGRWYRRRKRRTLNASA